MTDADYWINVGIFVGTIFFAMLALNLGRRW